MASRRLDSLDDYNNQNVKKAKSHEDQCVQLRLRGNELFEKARTPGLSATDRRRLLTDALSTYRSAVQFADGSVNQDLLASAAKNAAVASMELAEATNSLDPYVTTTHFKDALGFFEMAYRTGTGKSQNWIIKLENKYWDCAEKALETTITWTARQMIDAVLEYTSVMRKEDVKYMSYCSLLLRVSDVIKGNLEGDECDTAQGYIRQCMQIMSEAQLLSEPEDKDDLNKLRDNIEKLALRNKALKSITAADALFHDAKLPGAAKDRELAYDIISHYRDAVDVAKGTLPREIGRAYTGMANIYSTLLHDDDKAREHKNRAKLVISKYRSSQRLSRTEVTKPPSIQDKTAKEARAQMLSSKSIDLRNEGNIQFKAAHELQTLTEMQPFLVRAYNKYKEAMTVADTSDDLASAAKNAGTTAKELAELSSDIKEQLGLYKDALTYFQRALSEGIRAGKSGKWLMSLREASDKCLDTCLDVIDRAAPREACDTVEYIIDMVDGDDVRYKCQRRLSFYLYEHIKEALSQDNHVVALTLVKECKEVLEDAITLAPSLERPEMLQLKDFITVMSVKSKALQELKIADELLADIMDTSSIQNEEFVLEIVDRYRKVINMDVDSKFATTRNAYIGLARVFTQIRQDKKRSKEYRKKARDLGAEISTDEESSEDEAPTPDIESVEPAEPLEPKTPELPPRQPLTSIKEERPRNTSTPLNLDHSVTIGESSTEKFSEEEMTHEENSRQEDGIHSYQPEPKGDMNTSNSVPTEETGHSDSSFEAKADDQGPAMITDVEPSATTALLHEENAVTPVPERVDSDDEQDKVKKKKKKPKKVKVQKSPKEPKPKKTKKKKDKSVALDVDEETMTAQPLLPELPTDQSLKHDNSSHSASEAEMMDVDEDHGNDIQNEYTMATTLDIREPSNKRVDEAETDQIHTSAETGPGMGELQIVQKDNERMVEHPEYSHNSSDDEKPLVPQKRDNMFNDITKDEPQHQSENSENVPLSPGKDDIAAQSAQSRTAKKREERKRRREQSLGTMDNDNFAESEHYEPRKRMDNPPPAPPQGDASHDIMLQGRGEDGQRPDQPRESRSGRRKNTSQRGRPHGSRHDEVEHHPQPRQPDPRNPQERQHQSSRYDQNRHRSAGTDQHQRHRPPHHREHGQFTPTGQPVPHEQQQTDPHRHAHHPQPRHRDAKSRQTGAIPESIPQEHVQIDDKSHKKAKKKKDKSDTENDNNQAQGKTDAKSQKRQAKEAAKEAKRQKKANEKKAKASGRPHTDSDTSDPHGRPPISSQKPKKKKSGFGGCCGR